MLGLDIKGFVYAEIRKAVPTAPEPLRRPYKGRIYSCNKQNPYDLKEFVATVQEGDPSAYADGLYDEFIEYLQGEGAQTFHKRHQVHRNDTELVSAGYNVWQEATEMINPDLHIYPSPHKFGCSNCAFADPCYQLNRGEDVQYLLDSTYEMRGYHYWEQQEASTDKTGRG
jgi:hypothetical protein